VVITKGKTAQEAPIVKSKKDEPVKASKAVDDQKKPKLATEAERTQAKKGSPAK
jgi:hypothetical protein